MCLIKVTCNADLIAAVNCKHCKHKENEKALILVQKHQGEEISWDTNA